MFEGKLKRGVLGYFLTYFGLLAIIMMPARAEEHQLAIGEPVLLKGSATFTAEHPDHQLIPMGAGRVMEIDSRTRQLGGDKDLSNAPQKQLPTQKFPFFLLPQNIKDNVELTIGYIRGINTPEAHQEGQSNTPFVSSPAVIKVNGIRIQYIYTDGELIHVHIPKTVLRNQGFNVIQVEAGFYFLPGNQLAYDQLQLQHLALNY